MPFGLIFGAIVFAALCLWFGLSLLLLGPGPSDRAAGGILLVLGMSLSLGLLRRQSLARWTGVGTAILFAGLAMGNLARGGSVLAHVLLLAGLTTVALLVIPATGDMRRGLPVEAQGVPAAPRRGGVLGWTALASLVAFLAVFTWGIFRAAAPSGAPTLPEFGASGVRWLDYADGLAKAKAEGKPVLVDFYAEWCGPCKVMDRRTFRDPAVVERLSQQVVAVRVDSEETRSTHGYPGAALAERYRVVSYPTLMLLNGDGNVIATRHGFQSARELLSWLDQTLAAGLEARDPSKIPLAL